VSVSGARASRQMISDRPRLWTSTWRHARDVGPRAGHGSVAPTRGRCDRGTDSIQLATAQPGWILRGCIRQPRADVGAAAPHRQHYIEAAAKQRTGHDAVVGDTLVIVAQLAREQRAQLDRPVARRGCGKRRTGPDHSRPARTGPYPQPRVEVRPAPRANPRVPARQRRDRRALLGREPRPASTARCARRHEPARPRHLPAAAPPRRSEVEPPAAPAPAREGGPRLRPQPCRHDATTHAHPCGHSHQMRVRAPPHSPSLAEQKASDSS
jgi:hypothetical protein